MGASAQKKIGLDLTEGSILRGLLVFAVPIVLTNIIQQFYSLVDLMVVGQFVGSTGTAGVSSGGEIADLVTPVATSMAQVGSFLAAFYFMYKHKENFDFELKLSYFKIDRHSAEVILKQGLPQAVRSMLVRFSLLWVNANINSYGLTATATNGVGNKLQKFLDVFTTGLNQASSAMEGQNLGAKKQNRAAKTVWCTLGCTLVVATCLTAMSLLIPRQVFGIFTKDETVLDMGVFYMHMLIAHFFCSAVVTAFQSMVIGSGYASMSFMIGILDGVICKIGLSLIFVNIFDMGVYGYFWAVGFSRALPAVICFIFFMSGKWKTRKLLTD